MCGGLSRHLGLDVNVIRAVFVVAIGAVGLGLVVYLLAWGLTPTAETSEELLPVPPPNPWSLAGVGLVTAAVGASARLLAEELDLLLVPLGLGTVAALVFWARPPGRIHEPRVRWVAGPGPDHEDSLSRSDGGGGSATATATRTRTSPPVLASRYAPVLGPLTVGVLLAGFGFFALAEVTGAMDVPWGAVSSLALVGIGAVLMAGTWIGRPIGLVPIGAGLAAVLTLGSLIGTPLAGGIGARTVRAEGTAPVVERVAVGSLELDLSRLDLSAGPVDVSASVTGGELVVFVPAGVPVAIDARVGMGKLRLFEQAARGFSVSRDAHEPGDPAAIVAELKVGVGSLLVERVGEGAG